MTIERKYIGEKEVSELTGRAVQTLRNDRCKGVGFEYVKLGRSVKYEINDVIDFMESRKIETSDSRLI